MSAGGLPTRRRSFRDSPAARCHAKPRACWNECWATPRARSWASIRCRISSPRMTTGIEVRRDREGNPGGDPVPGARQQLRPRNRIPWHQEAWPAGKRHAIGLRAHDLRTEGADQPSRKTKAKPRRRRSARRPSAKRRRCWPTPKARPRKSGAKAKPKPQIPAASSSRIPSWPISCFGLRGAGRLAEGDRSTLIFDQHTPPFDLFRGRLNEPDREGEMNERSDILTREPRPLSRRRRWMRVRRRWPKRCAAALPSSSS